MGGFGLARHAAACRGSALCCTRRPLRGRRSGPSGRLHAHEAIGRNATSDVLGGRDERARVFDRPALAARLESRPQNRDLEIVDAAAPTERVRPSRRRNQRHSQAKESDTAEKGRLQPHDSGASPASSSTSTDVQGASAEGAARRRRRRRRRTRLRVASSASPLGASERSSAPRAPWLSACTSQATA